MIGQEFTYLYLMSNQNSSLYQLNTPRKDSKANDEYRANHEIHECMKDTAICFKKNTVSLLFLFKPNRYFSVAEMIIMPLGSIISWVTKPEIGANATHLPDDWVRCDGSSIPSSSIWAGQHTPNLNGEKRFLRGGDDGSQLKMEDDMMQDHSHELNDPGHQHDYDDWYLEAGHSQGAPYTSSGTYWLSRFFTI